jgi:hypothetical protein
VASWWEHKPKCDERCYGTCYRFKCVRHKGTAEIRAIAGIPDTAETDHNADGLTPRDYTPPPAPKRPKKCSIRDRMTGKC